MFVNIGGQRVYYEVNGSGPVVVLLHGWGASLNSLRGVFNHLVLRFRVYAVDLPGFGRSQPPTSVWGSADYAKLVADWAGEMDIQAACWLGHSFGGRIAIILGADYPHLVRKLILAGSAGIKPRRGLKYYLRVGAVKAARKVLPAKQMEAVYKLMGSSDYRQAGELRATLVKVVNEDLQERMPKISQPALLVWGEQDTATPVSDGQIMQKLIPNAQLVVLSQAGHYVYLDQPVLFLQAIDKFLRG